jgi:hypothetical protein
MIVAALEGLQLLLARYLNRYLIATDGPNGKSENTPCSPISLEPSRKKSNTDTPVAVATQRPDLRWGSHITSLTVKTATVARETVERWQPGIM